MNFPVKSSFIPLFSAQTGKEHKQPLPLFSKGRTKQRSQGTLESSEEQIHLEADKSICWFLKANFSLRESQLTQQYSPLSHITLSVIKLKILENQKEMLIDVFFIPSDDKGLNENRYKTFELSQRNEWSTPRVSLCSNYFKSCCWCRSMQNNRRESALFCLSFFCWTRVTWVIFLCRLFIVLTLLVIRPLDSEPETFISREIIKNLTTGRRSYIKEGEWHTDCWHFNSLTFNVWFLFQVSSKQQWSEPWELYCQYSQ